METDKYVESKNVVTNASDDIATGVKKKTKEEDIMERLRRSDFAINNAVNRKEGVQELKIPHNFSYGIMQKVDYAVVKRNQRISFMEYLCLAIISALGIAVMGMIFADLESNFLSIVTAFYTEIKEMKQNTVPLQMQYVLPFAFSFIFFVCLNNFLKKYFHKEK